MNLPDTEMVQALIVRDGPLRARSLPHNASGNCRYAELYPDGSCPWCAATARRAETSPPAPLRGGGEGRSKGM